MKTHITITTIFFILTFCSTPVFARIERGVLASVIGNDISTAFENKAALPQKESVSPKTADSLAVVRILEYLWRWNKAHANMDWPYRQKEINDIVPCFENFLTERAQRLYPHSAFPLRDYDAFLRLNTSEKEKKTVCEIFSVHPKGENISSFFRDIDDHKVKLEGFLDDLLEKRYNETKMSVRMRYIGIAHGQQIYTGMIFVYEALERLHKKYNIHEPLDTWIKQWDLQIDAFDRSFHNFVYCKRGAFYRRVEMPKLKDEITALGGTDIKRTKEIMSRYFSTHERFGDAYFTLQKKITAPFTINYQYIDLLEETIDLDPNDTGYDLTMYKYVNLYIEPVEQQCRVFDAIFSTQRPHHLYIGDYWYTVETKNYKPLMSEYDRAQIKEHLGIVDLAMHMGYSAVFFGKDTADTLLSQLDITSRSNWDNTLAGEILPEEKDLLFWIRDTAPTFEEFAVHVLKKSELNYNELRVVDWALQRVRAAERGLHHYRSGRTNLPLISTVVEFFKRWYQEDPSAIYESIYAAA